MEINETKHQIGSSIYSSDNQKHIKAVIFDLGRVLVSIDADRGLLRCFNRYLGKEIEPGLIHKMTYSAYSDYVTGKIPSEEFYTWMCRQFDLQLTFDQFRNQWCDIFGNMNGMEAIVKELVGKVKLGILSDTDPLHWAYICEHWPFIANIENPTLSFEIHYCKPALESYLKAAQQVNVSPSECLFIDDLQINVDGAKSAGMDSIKFTNIEEFRRQLFERDLLHNVYDMVW